MQTRMQIRTQSSCMRKRPSYPTDLTDEEWRLVQPLIPPPRPGGRPRSQDVREVINAIRYLQTNHCSWRSLPTDFPPWQTVYDYLRGWRDSGTWDAISQRLGERQVNG